MAGCVGCISLIILLQFAAAIAIIVIIPVHLQDITFNAGQVENGRFWEGFSEKNTCLLGTGFRNSHLCTYGIAAAAISVAASLLISFMQCITCNFCSMGPFVDVIFQGAGTAWWIIASIIVSKYARQADRANFPEQEWRDTVMYLSWALGGLFFIGFCLSIGRSLNVCCEGSRRRPKPAAAPAPQFVTYATPYAAQAGAAPSAHAYVQPTHGPTKPYSAV